LVGVSLVNPSGKRKKEKEPDSVGTIERNKPLKYSGKGQ
jgi:hypothetical protein